jgi:hypothetical protein
MQNWVTTQVMSGVVSKLPKMDLDGGWEMELTLMSGGNLGLEIL